MSDPLIDSVRQLLDDAASVFADVEGVDGITQARARLDEPLRVAIAGKVKAGKSTLLNALVGEKVAPTDTGECTRIVTWYQDGHVFRVMLHPADDIPPIQARFHRDDGAIEVDLEGYSPAEVDKLEITWPTRSLAAITLIDTPGVDTLSDDIAGKAQEFLDPKDTETPADAVLYLMKHIHSSDVRLLEAFHDEAVSQPNPVNAIAILSRADEIGGGRVDSMASARRIANRYGNDAGMRRLVQLVLPVAGLLAESARTLTESEFKALSELASVPRKDLDKLLLSADRFVRANAGVPLTDAERQHLLNRLGVFGIRQSMALLRSRKAKSSVELADELVQRSGLVDLQTVLTTLFVDRATVLKSRSALLAIERLCEQYQRHPGAGDIHARIEQVMAGAHPFNELATLAAIRSGRVKGRREELSDLEQILGASGTADWQRLGLEPESNTEQINNAAMEALGRWQRVAEHPGKTQDLKQVAAVAIRSMEAVVAKTYQG